MKHTWRAIELKGKVDEQGQLSLKIPLPVKGPGPVQLVVLLPNETDETNCDEEHVHCGESEQPADYTVTVWHDFRVTRTEYTKMITLGFLEGTH